MFKKDKMKTSLVEALDMFLKLLFILFLAGVAAVLLAIGIYWTSIITVIVCLLVLFLVIFLIIWYNNSTYC